MIITSIEPLEPGKTYNQEKLAGLVLKDATGYPRRKFAFYVVRNETQGAYESYMRSIGYDDYFIGDYFYEIHID